MVMTTRPQSEKVNVWEIGGFLKNHWKRFLIGGVSGAFIGLALYAVLPSKYQASVEISPARVGSIITGGFVQGVEPEPAYLLIERFKQPGFFTPAIAERCQVALTPGYQKEMAKDLSGSVVKLPNSTAQTLSLIKLNWNASSPKLAEDCLLAVVQGVTETQNRMIIPIVEKLAAQTKLTQAEVDLFTSELNKLAARSASKEVTAGNFNQMVIADKAAQNLRESLVSARRQLSEDQAKLVPPYTQGTTILEPIYASPTPIFTAQLAGIIGFLAGLFLSIVALLIKRSVQSYYSRLAS